MFHEEQYFYFCFSEPYSFEENTNIFVPMKKTLMKVAHIVAFLE